MRVGDKIIPPIFPIIHGTDAPCYAIGFTDSAKQVHLFETYGEMGWRLMQIVNEASRLLKGSPADPN